MLQNETLLAQAGTVTWGPERTRAGLFSGLIKRPDLIGPTDVLAARRSAARLRMEIDALADSGTARLIVSEENVLGAMPLCVAQDTLYPDLRGRIERVAEAFGPHLTGLALSIRRYDMWWASVLSIMLNRGHSRPEAARLARLAQAPQGWRRVIEIARAATGLPITVWPFEALVGRHGAQLLAMAPDARLPEGLYDSGRVQNAGPSGAALMQRLIALEGEARALDQGEDGHYMPFTTPQRGAMAARYLADLAWARSAPEGLRFIENDAGRAGAHPPAATEEEGVFRHDQDRRLGPPRAEGAA